MSAVDKITSGIDVWLRREVSESNTGRNGYLDDYDVTRRGIVLPASEPNAFDARKSQDHFMRYKLLLDALDEEALKTSDRGVGRSLHHALMFVSGGFRQEANLKAGNQTEYDRLRFGRLEETNGATNISIQHIVEQVMLAGYGHSVDLPAYFDRNYEANKTVRDNHATVAEWFRDNPARQFTRIADEELPVELAVDSQRQGLMLAASHFLVVATLRDIDPGEVPLYGPKSITDAELTTLNILTMQF